MSKMISSHVSIEVADTVEDAPKYGEDVTLLRVSKMIVVGKGTESGNPTVDIQLEDESGKKFLIMTTGSIVECMGTAAKTKREMDEAK